MLICLRNITKTQKHNWVRSKELQKYPILFPYIKHLHTKKHNSITQLSMFPPTADSSRSLRKYVRIGQKSNFPSYSPSFKLSVFQGLPEIWWNLCLMKPSIFFSSINLTEAFRNLLKAFTFKTYSKKSAV